MAQGLIWVRNGGGYVARFSVKYKLRESVVEKSSGNFTLGVNKSIVIDDGATDVAVKIEALVFFGSWTDIATYSFPGPVTKYYEVYGTTLNPKIKELSGPNAQAQAESLQTAPTTPPVTYHDEDILTSIEPDEGFAATTYPAAQEKQVAFAVPLKTGLPEGASALHGCIALITGVSLCYDVSLSPLMAKLTLSIAGLDVGSVEITPERPCATIKAGKFGFKVELNICLRDLHRITLEGKACAPLAGCKSFNITVVSW